MKTTTSFMPASQFLAPDDLLISLAVQRSPEEPVSFQTEAFILVRTDGEDMVGKPVPIRYPITLRHALRVKSAETWLELGQPDEALRHLEQLPRKAWDHPWAFRVRVAALAALRELTGQAHTE